MSGFFGRYDYQLDDKGRVSLPSAFRREADGERFVLLQWRPPALTLFPESTWEGVQQRLLDYRRNNPDDWTSVIALMANAVEVSPDKQGRILIPAWLQEAGSLDGSVRMVGAIDRVEVWDPETFDRTVAEGSGQLEQFAAKIFG